MKQSYLGIVERVANAQSEKEVLTLVEEATKYGDIAPRTLRRVKRKAQANLTSLATPKKVAKQKVAK